MGQANQIYCRWKRLLPSTDKGNELYLVIDKDKPMSLDTIKEFDERFKDEDVIITVTKLIRGKRGRK